MKLRGSWNRGGAPNEMDLAARTVRAGGGGRGADAGEVHAEVGAGRPELHCGTIASILASWPEPERVGDQTHTYQVRVRAELKKKSEASEHRGKGPVIEHG